MLQQYIFRLMMLLTLVVAGTLLVGGLYRRTRPWSVLLGIVLILVLFLQPVRNRVGYLEQRLMIRLYGSKYRGKSLDYARAELGAPYAVVHTNEAVVWKYEHLVVISGNAEIVLDIQRPDNVVGSYK